MKTINDIFRASLNKELKSTWGAQSKLAKLTGFSTGKINNLTSGAREGSEQDRRLIAKELGYHSYEAFLDVGRKALGLPTMAEEAASGANQVPPWLKPMLNDLSNLDEHGQKAVKAAIDAFKK